MRLTETDVSSLATPHQHECTLIRLNQSWIHRVSDATLTDSVCQKAHQTLPFLYLISIRALFLVLHSSPPLRVAFSVTGYTHTLTATVAHLRLLDLIRKTLNQLFPGGPIGSLTQTKILFSH